MLHNKGVRKLQAFGILRMNLLMAKDARFIGDTSISFPNEISLPLMDDETEGKSNSYKKDYLNFSREMQKLHQYDPCLGKSYSFV
jgi:hypothetical protein